LGYAAHEAAARNVDAMGRGLMRFRPTRTFAAPTLALGALAAASAEAVRPEAVADGNTLVTPVWRPVGLDRQAVTIMDRYARKAGVRRPFASPELRE
jgi:hypothetical protein